MNTVVVYTECFLWIREIKKRQYDCLQSVACMHG